MEFVFLEEIGVVLSTLEQEEPIQDVDVDVNNGTVDHGLRDDCTSGGESSLVDFLSEDVPPLRIVDEVLLSYMLQMNRTMYFIFWLISLAVPVTASVSSWKYLIALRFSKN